MRATGSTFCGTTEFEYSVIPWPPTAVQKEGIIVHLTDLNIGMSITNNCERCFAKVLELIGRKADYMIGTLPVKFTYFDSDGEHNEVRFNPGTFENVQWVR
jgi:hypothetical protein